MTKEEENYENIFKQDINDIKGLANYKRYGLSKQKAKLLANGIVKNLKDHIKYMFEAEYN